MTIAAVLLAAGSSSRLGYPKQLVLINGEPLIRRSAQTVLEAGCQPVTVVLGAQSDAVGAAVQDLPVLLVRNPNWSDGVGSSIACGIDATTPYRPSGCIVLPCDQPKLSASLLETLIEQFRFGGSQAVACKYGDTIGVPVLFAWTMFKRLSTLTGDNGAKRLLGDCTTLNVVDFPGGEIDIDTDADLPGLTS